jgi:acyl-CoA reductase-like NAD-dependent aldehyde dehydrogenase
VLTDVDDEMTVMTQETFGPVMPIAVVRDEDEAIARANRSVYGLTASVWTRDLERGRKIAARLKCGVVTINNQAFTAALPDAPWHGRGQSGGGVTNSRLAFLDLVEPRYVLMDRSKANETWWFPHNTTAATIARALAQLFSRGGNKLEALLALLKNFPKRWT